MKLQIKKVREAPFTGNDGNEIEYWWYKAVREGDGVTIEFGSKMEYEVGQDVDPDLEKYETKSGYRYKETR